MFRYYSIYHRSHDKFLSCHCICSYLNLACNYVCTIFYNHDVNFSSWRQTYWIEYIFELKFILWIYIFVKCKTKDKFGFFIISKNLNLILLYQNTPNTNGEIVVFDEDLDLQIKIQNFNVLIYLYAILNLKVKFQIENQTHKVDYHLLYIMSWCETKQSRFQNPRRFSTTDAIFDQR